MDIDREAFHAAYLNIVHDNDPEFMKMVRLYNYMTRPEVQAALGKGSIKFILGIGDEIISFYDLAQVYNDFYNLVVNAILDY